MKIIPHIPVQFVSEFPEDFVLNNDGWRFSEEEMKEKLPDGTRKLLTLDLTIPPEDYSRKVNQGKSEGLTERSYKYYGMICPNNCPGCFEKFPLKNPVLTWQEIADIIEQAVDLGLKTARFLGLGEIFTNPDLFMILDFFKEKNIKLSIFTKGAELGDDELSIRYQGMGSEELCRKIASYDNVYILMDCRTLDKEKANSGTHSISRNYIKARTRAIERLCDLGLNRWPRQRLTLQTNPVLMDNIDEVVEIFKWGAVRNLPVRICPTMISGRGQKLVKISQTETFKRKLKDVGFEVYKYLIESGIMTLEEVKKEGVSNYIGTTPCCAVVSGMFIRKDGTVAVCTGNDSEKFIIDNNIRKKSLKDIWKGSMNYKMEPVFNNRCIAKDGITIPYDFYDFVLEKLKETFGD